MDIAGVVSEVGADVRQFNIGDRVFGENGGGYAEYVAAPARRLVAIPDGMTFEQAAAVPLAAISALQALRDRGNVGEGDHVLIIGASGGVGTFAVQIAKALGAQVTAVCSTRNVEMVRSIGADTVVDYTTTSVVDVSDRFDAIIDMAGADTPVRLRRLLVDDGVYVSVGSSSMGDWAGPILHLIRLSLGSMFRSKKMVSMLAKQTPEDMATLNQLFEAGQMRPVMDRTFALDETPEAIRIQGHKHAQGKSVVVL
jgi:NADPH:quinone reductase-like Zn-dependent oxidoreductase